MKLIQVVLVMLLFSVSSHLMSLDIGDKAPGFTLEATDGKTYSLDQFLNKEAVVIAWYPKAFTSGCTIECKSLALNGHLLKDLEVASTNGADAIAIAHSLHYKKQSLRKIRDHALQLSLNVREFAQ